MAPSSASWVMPFWNCLRFMESAGRTREKIRRKDRDVLVVQLWAAGERIAKLIDAWVEQTDDVARPGFLHGFAFVRHELLGLLERDGLVRPGVPDLHAFLERAGECA